MKEKEMVKYLMFGLVFLFVIAMAKVVFVVAQGAGGLPPVPNPGTDGTDSVLNNYVATHEDFGKVKGGAISSSVLIASGIVAVSMIVLLVVFYFLKKK